MDHGLTIFAAIMVAYVILCVTPWRWLGAKLKRLGGLLKPIPTRARRLDVRARVEDMNRRVGELAASEIIRPGQALYFDPGGNLSTQRYGDPVGIAGSTYDGSRTAQVVTGAWVLESRYDGDRVFHVNDVIRHADWDMIPEGMAAVVTGSRRDAYGNTLVAYHIGQERSDIEDERRSYEGRMLLMQLLNEPWPSPGLYSTLFDTVGSVNRGSEKSVSAGEPAAQEVRSPGVDIELSVRRLDRRKSE